MRTLKLTHEQIETLEKALSIAAKQTFELFKNVSKVDESIGLSIYKIENQICDLATDIKNGDLDV